MGIVVDSTIIIEIERTGRERPEELLHTLPDESFLASITVSEVLVGAHLADTDSRRSGRLALIDAPVSRCPVIPFGESEARVHAQLRVELRQQGIAVGSADLLIAATTMANAHALLTRNVAEFQRVPGLRVLMLDQHGKSVEP